ncbi:alanine racemase [Pseudoalteromonas sp. NC201]|uniref:alanine racemase n=1 Tax=Pseudoalteromonas sp. NC201 TaxID=1514074 RepID=UPI000C7D167C|nr:alanine racemase [Pseudoalteromonas sp. NC201]AUJ72289.1 D-threonine aldolase [Pseudoalteromonas sp. NC201]
MTILAKGTGDPLQLEGCGWDILAEQVSLPVAVIKQDAISHNANWMVNFAKESQVLLAPHGKTTMSPALFTLQLEHGAWAITVATVPQVSVAIVAGAKRVILANQLVGEYHMKQVASMLTDTDVELYCFVDSIANAHALGTFFTQHSLRISILLEVGVEGGRAGWRNLATIVQLVNVCQQYASLEVAGIGFYEGVIHGHNAEQRIATFVDSVIKTAADLRQKNVFSKALPIITGAGSAWYDVVTKTLNKSEQAQQFRFVIRPGCYLIHDTGIYQDAQQAVLSRSNLACDLGESLVSSLSIWAYVLSTPEPGVAIIGMGKRDVAFDAGMPTPELIYSPPSKQLCSLGGAVKVEKIMDQHAMVSIAFGCEVQVGDMICFSTSHPCLTFDKWRQIGVVERDWVITQTISTYF